MSPVFALMTRQAFCFRNDRTRLTKSFVLYVQEIHVHVVNCGVF